MCAIFESEISRKLVKIKFKSLKIVQNGTLQDLKFVKNLFPVKSKWHLQENSLFFHTVVHVQISHDVDHD